MGFPVDISKRAGPGQVAKLRDARFAKRPVKTRVVRDHHIHTLQHGRDTRLVQTFALQVGIGNAGQRHHFFGNSTAWVFQFIKHLHQSQGLARRRVHVQAQHGQFDNFFFGLVQTGGLGVQNQDARAARSGRVVPMEAHRQASQHAVVGVCVQ